MPVTHEDVALVLLNYIGWLGVWRLLVLFVVIGGLMEGSYWEASLRSAEDALRRQEVLIEEKELVG